MANPREVGMMTTPVFGLNALLAATLTIALTMGAALAGPGDVRGGVSKELAPVEACTYNAAMITLRRQGFKVLQELPLSVTAFRFLGAKPELGEWVGASVDRTTCAVTFLTNLGMRRPWCEYLPRPCPTARSQ
jgi:hypothetical protein